MKTVRRITFAPVFLGAVLLPGCVTPTGVETLTEPPPGYGQQSTASKPPISRAQAGTNPAPQQPPKPPAPPTVIDVPRGLPGSAAPLPELPPDRPETRAARLKLIDQLFSTLPALGPDPLTDATPDRPAKTLDELLDYAKKHSPAIAQAAADVEKARGDWLQAGLYPNPTAGYQGDQMGVASTWGQQGGFLNQTIVTAGKLKLARSVAFYDYTNAQLRLRKAEVDLVRQVRSDYYEALVAAESVRVARLICDFTEVVYRRQVAMVKGGTAVPFEASAIEALVGQSRANLFQSRNRYVSAWKQLAAGINAPDMPPAALAGRVDTPMPRYQYDALRERMLANHTDLAVVRNTITQAEQTLRLEQVRPTPDVLNNLYFQRDFQSRTYQVGYQMGFQVPVWNRNQGKIISSIADLQRSTREVDRVRNDLVRQLAEAFERYEATRLQLALYENEILPNLVRAFRGVNQRYEVEPDKVNYNDIVTAQQNLSTRLYDYLSLLRQQWQAAADIAGIVQATTLEELPVAPPGTPDSWPDTGFKK